MKDTRAQIDILYDEVREYREIDAFQDMLKSLKPLPNLAPFNAMLVQMQKPGSRWVLSAGQWKDRFGRYPKPGSRPLVIMRPFGPISFVYEYGDTEGREVTDEMIRKHFVEPFRAEQVVDAGTLYDFTEKLHREGIRYREEPYGTTMGGQIIRMERIDSKHLVKTTSVANHFVEQHACIVVNSSLKPTEKFITVLHELGHFFCGHLGTFGMKHIPVRDDLTKEIEEFEAETACWICCNRLGIDNPGTVDYLAGYKEEHGQIPPVSIDTILKAAGCIENVIHKDGNIRIGLKVIEKFPKENEKIK